MSGRQGHLPIRIAGFLDRFRIRVDYAGGHFELFILPVESPYFNGSPCSSFSLIVGRYDHIDFGVIILRYSNDALLEVNTDDDHSTEVNDFFLFFLLYYSKPFR